MKIAIGILIGALSTGPLQDEWKPMALTRIDQPADSGQAGDSSDAAGLVLTPSPGAIGIAVTVDNPCQAKIRAAYQYHGAVVKVRLIGPPADRRCAGHRPETYQASVTKLKQKRYQVVVYTADEKDRWRPWKAGVAEVP
jgi:hypothetical protein